MGLRRVAGAALLAVTLGLSACTSAPTVGDGDIGSDWAVLPTPSVGTPEAGGCTAAPTADEQKVHWSLSVLLDFLPGVAVDCSQPHLIETYHIGSFPADVDTDPNSPPTLGTARFRFAYTACVAAAGDFLGADPHTSRLAVVPVMPSERQWAGLARWFRCELAELTTFDRVIAVRSASLRDALRAPGPLTPICANVVLDDDSTLVQLPTYVPCDTAHDVEQTGVYTLPDGDYPGGAAFNALIPQKCREAGAEYVGVPVDGLLEAGTDTIAFGFGITEPEWSAGERSAACFYGSDVTAHTGSVKGLGAIPY